MVHHADAIAARLCDEVPFVRQSAAVALGCLGRSTVRYERHLLALLNDSSPHVRYASLVALGGLLAKALPHARSIAEHLTDDHPKCWMAALRALKCMGKTAEPYAEKLRRWQQKWFQQVHHDYSTKPEPITTRALLFASTPLKDIFRGHAPLGRRFAGSEATRQARTAALKNALSVKMCSAAEVADEESMALVTLSDGNSKEARADYIAAQARYRAVDAERRLQRRQVIHSVRQGADRQVRSHFPLQVRRSDGAAKSSRSSRRSIAEVVDDWLIPIRTLAAKAASQEY
jgi:hypothetical protein